MARRSLSSGSTQPPAPLRLADVDIVLPESTGSAGKVIPGADVAALLDVTADTEAVLDPEDIARRLQNIADLLATLAEAVTSPADGALYAAEHAVRQLVARVDGLRPGADRLSEQYRIVPRRAEDAAQEEFAPYRVVLPLPDGVTRIAAVAGSLGG
jgi:hypothetical protein